MGGTAHGVPVFVHVPVTEFLVQRVPVSRLQSKSVTLRAVIRGMSASKATCWYGCVLPPVPVTGLEKVIGVGAVSAGAQRPAR